MPINLIHALTIIGLGIVIIAIIGVIYFNVDWNRFRGKKILESEITDELRFYRQYKYYGSYSSGDRRKREKLSEIIDYFRKSIKNDCGVNIESNFNGLIYPVFDLDSQEKLDLFKNLYSTDTYVIFRSSQDHYWGILDSPTEKIEEIFYDHNWKTCNDQQYVEFSREYEKLYLRGIYENEDRKPRIFETNENLSKNFQLFINKLSIYFSKEGLELSVLRYKDPTLLIKFNRKLKLKQLNENEDR